MIKFMLLDPTGVSTLRATRGIGLGGTNQVATGVGVGVLPAKDVIPIALANAQRASSAPGLFNVGYCFISVE